MVLSGNMQCVCDIKDNEPIGLLVSQVLMLEFLVSHGSPFLAQL